MYKPNFDNQQKDWICYQIGEWYLKWKNGLIDQDSKTHRLGFAKEELKSMVCDDWEDFRGKEDFREIESYDRLLIMFTEQKFINRKLHKLLMFYRLSCWILSTSIFIITVLNIVPIINRF